jgi:ParB-like chromosome segregation protein Spo0J
MVENTTNEEPVVQEQLKLPYEEIVTVASRDITRKLVKQGNKETYLVPLSSMRVRDQFNVPREKPEYMTEEEWLADLKIDELAKDIEQNGQKEAFVGDFLEDGTFVISKGHRRFLARLKLLNEGVNVLGDGKPTDIAEVHINPRSITEAQRVYDMFSDDNKLPYKTVGLAMTVHRLFHSFKEKREDIATKTRRSRQWVDDMLILAGEPSEIKRAVDEGRMSYTAAVALARKNKNAESRKKVVKEAEEKGETVKVKDVAGMPGTTEDGTSGEYVGIGKSKAVKTETKEALDVEMKSRETDGKYKDPRKKDDREDALSKDIDKPLEGWEIFIARASGNLDKLLVKANQLPKELKQHSEDMMQLCNWSTKALEDAKEEIRRLLKSAGKE